MTGKVIEVGAKLPEATLLWMGADDAEPVVLSEKLKGRKVAILFDDLDYQPGDGFWVEVRSPIPVAERGDRRQEGGEDVVGI